MTDVVDRLKMALADRYAIERELGRGGMATVYLAEDLKHRRKVAIKVLHPELAATLGPDRFLREIEIAAGLQHPHILPLYDSGHADGFLYYVMPFVEGQSLRARLNREGALPIAETARILRDVADALAHAHDRKVVHRDIKPDNVMLSGRHAMVTDFGVAKAVSEASGRHNLTTAGVALGTPAYMAPEQAAAEPNLDHRVDVYALGAMAYELLTGHVPFDKGSAAATLAAHVTEAPRPVSEHRGTVPPALSQMVMKCLEKRPADRWQRADELVPVLESLATPSGGITPTDTRPIEAVSLRGRNKWVAVGALAAALVTLIWFGRGRWPTLRATGGQDVVRLAVVPFANLGRAQDEFFAEGVTDAIRRETVRIPGLLVLGRQTSSQYKQSDKTSTEIGHLLNVDYILTGTIQWDGKNNETSRVLVNPELLRVSDETSMWQDSYVFPYQDIFDVQASIALKAAGAISGALDARASSATLDRSPRTKNLEAHTLYMKGDEEWRRFSSAGRERAIGYLQRAIQADSAYAPAWSVLSLALTGQGRRGEGRAAAERAIALDSKWADGYSALAQLQWYEWDFAGAATSFQRALALEPNDGVTLGLYAIYLAAVGRYEEGVTAGTRAAFIDPLAAGEAALYSLMGLKRYGDVIRIAEQGLAADSMDRPGGYYGLMVGALMESGRFEEGLRTFERGQRIWGWSPSRIGWALARAHRTAEARSLLQQALARTEMMSNQQAQTVLGNEAWWIAAIYANLGQSDSAFAWLNRVVPTRGRALAEIRWRPEFSVLRSDARFRELVRTIGLEK
ncbi:MAG: protein kinase [Gemmatimonadetes bacterium]|nr:protein kinase [Gemmatimonadota bacterium]